MSSERRSLGKDLKGGEHEGEGAPGGGDGRCTDPRQEPVWVLQGVLRWQ